MKIILWFIAITGTSYFYMYLAGNELITQYAVGPLWVLMLASPMLLIALIVLPILARHFPTDE